MNTTVLIIIVIAVVLLGVLSVLLDVRKRYKQQRQIRDYTAKVGILAQKLRKNKNATQEATYIIAHSHEMSELFNDPMDSTITLSSRLTNGGYYGIEKYINEIGEDELQTLQRLENEKHDIKKQLWNPFTLFYRGIGLVLRYVFGYLIELFNKDFDYEGKTWKIINLLVTLAASIFTIMTFFGYDWAEIVKFFS